MPQTFPDDARDPLSGFTRRKAERAKRDVLPPGAKAPDTVVFELHEGALLMAWPDPVDVDAPARTHRIEGFNGVGKPKRGPAGA